MGAILIFKCTKGAGVGDYSSRGRGALDVGRSRFYLEKCPFNLIIITVSKGDVCKHAKSMLNVSGMFFFVNGFDTHLRWPPSTQSLWSGRSYGKIGDCEQSTNFISQKLSDSAVILATAVSKRCTQDLPVVNTQGSITGFLAHTWCKKAVKLTSDAQQLIQRSHWEVITIEPRKIIARKQRQVKTPRKTRIFVYLPFGHSRNFFFKDFFSLYLLTLGYHFRLTSSSSAFLVFRKTLEQDAISSV